MNILARTKNVMPLMIIAKRQRESSTPALLLPLYRGSDEAAGGFVDPPACLPCSTTPVARTNAKK